MTECFRRLKFDVILGDLSAPDGWKSVENPDGTLVDEWGRVLIHGSRCREWIPYRSIFETPEDVKDFSFPDPNVPGRTFAVEYTKKIVGDEMAVAGHVRDSFAHAWEMFTPMKFVRWMYENPQFMGRVLEKITEFNVEMIKRVADVGVDFIIVSGDYCEKNGPMVPVKFFRGSSFQI